MPSFLCDGVALWPIACVNRGGLPMPVHVCLLKQKVLADGGASVLSEEPSDKKRKKTIFFDYLWIFLFFIFVITNSIFFSMLFYTPNTNSLAYLFLFIVPVILILIFLSFRLPIIKSIILLCFILSLTKNIRKLWFSKRFRLYLK